MKRCRLSKNGPHKFGARARNATCSHFLILSQKVSRNKKVGIKNSGRWPNYVEWQRIFPCNPFRAQGSAQHPTKTYIDAMLWPKFAPGKSSLNEDCSPGDLQFRPRPPKIHLNYHHEDVPYCDRWFPGYHRLRWKYHERPTGCGSIDHPLLPPHLEGVVLRL